MQLHAMQGRSQRREAAEEARAQNWLLQQALAPLMPPASQLPFVLRVVIDNLGLAGPPHMPALNAAVLAAASANFPLSQAIAGWAQALQIHPDCSRYNKNWAQ